MATEQKISSIFEARAESRISYERASFAVVADLELAAQSTGWKIDYRRMGSGAFLGGFSGMQCGSISLLSEHFNNSLNIACQPPQDQIGIFFPGLLVGGASCCGHTIEDGDLIVLPSGSDLEVSTNGECFNETLYMPQLDFLKAARAILRSDDQISLSSAFICSGDPTRVARFRQLIISIGFLQELDPEKASSLLAEAIHMVAEATNIQSSEKLTDSVVSRVALRAQTFIEDNLDDIIRTEELCTHAGASLRTLQRCFSAHFQVSPTHYIKARRLNAVRRILAESLRQEQTVTNIAMASGFYHLGRFSADYLDFFGEHPSDTLKRSKK
jgi:AraC family ethanolamine operon transcriptional activator